MSSGSGASSWEPTLRQHEQVAEDSTIPQLLSSTVTPPRPFSGRPGRFSSALQGRKEATNDQAVRQARRAALLVRDAMRQKHQAWHSRRQGMPREGSDHDSSAPSSSCSAVCTNEGEHQKRESPADNLSRGSGYAENSGSHISATYASSPPSSSSSAIDVKAKFVVFGGFGDQGDMQTSGVAYDYQAGQWHPFPPMQDRRLAPGAAVCDGKLYVCGGVEEQGKTMECFDPVLDRWQRMASMRVARCGFQLATLGGQLYALGGVNDCLSSQKASERFDPRASSDDSSGAWFDIPDLLCEAALFVASPFYRRILMCGGCERRFNRVTQTLDSAQWYDPDSHSWTHAPRMSRPRASHAGTVLRNAVYVCGGVDECMAPLPLVERFTISRSAEGEWEALQSMPIAREGHCVASIAGQLFVFGGSPGGSKSVLAFNSWSQAWSTCQPMQEGREHLCVQVLKI